jgi:hypothetical protein
MHKQKKYIQQNYSTIHFNMIHTFTTHIMHYERSEIDPPMFQTQLMRCPPGWGRNGAGGSQDQCDARLSIREPLVDYLGWYVAHDVWHHAPTLQVQARRQVGRLFCDACRSSDCSFVRMGTSRRCLEPCRARPTFVCLFVRKLTTSCCLGRRCPLAVLLPPPGVEPAVLRRPR